MINTLQKISVGDKVYLDASGYNCVKAFHHCVGIVKTTSLDPSWIKVLITDGHRKGSEIGFYIGGSNFKCELLVGDWDE